MVLLVLWLVSFSALSNWKWSTAVSTTPRLGPVSSSSFHPMESETLTYTCVVTTTSTYMTHDM